MAISVSLIVAGLNLLNTVIGKIWQAEKDGKRSNKDKHELVRGYALAYIEDHNIEVDDIDGFIADFIRLLNKHKIFIKGD